MVRLVRVTGLEVHLRRAKYWKRRASAPTNPFRPMRGHAGFVGTSRTSSEGKACRLPASRSGSSRSRVRRMRDASTWCWRWKKVSASPSPRLDFVGNDSFSDEPALRRHVHPAGRVLLVRRGRLPTDINFELDLLESLPRHYRRAGFLDFEVLGDTLVVDPNTGKARIEIQVEEGPQYRLAEFRVEGADAFETEDLERYYRTESGGLLSAFGFGGGEAEREGAVFDLVAFEEAAQRVREAYNNEGYLYAQVEPFSASGG